MILISCTYCQDYPNLDAQINSLRQAIKGNPNNPELYFELGMVYESQGKYVKAKEALKQAIKLNPNHAKAYNLLGHIFEKERDYPLAIEHYQKAIQGDDKFMEPCIALSSLYRDMGLKSFNEKYTQKQLEILSKALKKCDRTKFKDDCISILNNLCVVLLEGRTANRDKILKTVIEYAEQGLELLRDEDDLKKYAYYSNNNQINFDRGLFHYNLGEAYRELNDSKRAIDAYNEALNEFNKAKNEYWIRRIEDAKRELKGKV